MQRRRKGQWFLIGGFILIMLLSYVATMRGQVMINEDTHLERNFAFSNVKSATRSTISQIVSEDTSKEHIEARLFDWVYILRTFAAERASNISGFILLGVPHAGYVNATLINFFQQELSDVNLSVGSASVNGVHVSDGNASTFYLPEASNYFLVNMTYYLDRGSGMEAQSVYFNTTRKAFFIYELRLTKRAGEQVMQSIEYG